MDFYADGRWYPLERGMLPRILFAASSMQLTGVLRLKKPGQTQLFVLRRGHWIAPKTPNLTNMLASLSISQWDYQAEKELRAYPPTPRRFDLGKWAKHHVSGQLDALRAQRLERELSSCRLLAQIPQRRELFDPIEWNVVETLTVPRQFSELLGRCGTPRFRLLQIVHVLERLGIVSIEEAMTASLENDPYAILGVSPHATTDEIRAAYRRLARSLHPDLQPENEHSRNHDRLAQINSAYASLTGRV